MHQTIQVMRLMREAIADPFASPRSLIFGIMLAAAAAAGPFVIHEMIVWQDCQFKGVCAPENAQDRPVETASR